MGDSMKKKLNYKKLYRNLQRTWQYVKKYKINLFIYLFISLILSLFGILVPYLTSKVIIYLTDEKFNLLILISFLILITGVLRSILNLISERVYTLVFEKITLNIRIDIIKEIFTISSSEFDKNSSGAFLDRISRDCNRLSRIFEDISLSLIDIFTNIGILIVIFSISKLMFIFIIISFVAIFIIEKVRIKQRHENRKQMIKIYEETTGLNNEFMRGIRDIKALNVEDSFTEMLEKKLYDNYNKEYELMNITRKYGIIGSAISSMFQFVFIILGVIILENKLLTIDNFVLIYMYKDKASRLIFGITKLIQTIKDFNLSADRVFDIVDNNSFEKEKFGTQKLKNFTGNIELRNVNFAYTEEKQVLKDLCMNIPTNKTIAIVGKSGSGKSTIISLINKLYPVSDNSIFFDNVDINKLDKKSIRGNIALVTQNPYLFNLSIIDNFKLIKKNVTEKEIIEVCKLASIHDDIINLENGYNTIIGEGGVILSGGQRQRIAIARALLKKAKVIILDEATSALDNETQNNIKEAVDNIKGTQTIIVIAHRLSTVINSDIIYYLNKGKITASGTHNELLTNCKEYKKLYEKEI